MNPNKSAQQRSQRNGFWNAELAHHLFFLFLALADDAFKDRFAVRCQINLGVVFVVTRGTFVVDTNEAPGCEVVD
ncbi:hypothetical protein D3C80_1977280 [compost metagenome]